MLQKPLARRNRAIDAIKTLLERRVDAVRTLWGRCVHAITGKIHVYRRITRRSYSAMTYFQNAVQTLWHRRVVGQGFAGPITDTVDSEYLKQINQVL